MKMVCVALLPNHTHTQTHPPQGHEAQEVSLSLPSCYLEEFVEVVPEELLKLPPTSSTHPLLQEQNKMGS